ASASRSAADVDVWSIACLDVAEQRRAALEKLGNILGFVAAYILGPDPEGRGVPPDLVPAVRALRASYTTRQREMDPGLTRRLGLFDYLRARLAVAGTPDDCVAPVRALRASYTTRQREMDPGLTRRLGLFDYLRARLAVAGTPDDCVAQVRAAEAA